MQPAVLTPKLAPWLGFEGKRWSAVDWWLASLHLKLHKVPELDCGPASKSWPQVLQFHPRMHGEAEPTPLTSLEAESYDFPGKDMGSLNVPIEKFTQPLGIWSIVATIRWCPIFAKWDSYQPLQDDTKLHIKKKLVICWGINAITLHQRLVVEPKISLSLGHLERWEIRSV